MNQNVLRIDVKSKNGKKSDRVFVCNQFELMPLNE